MTVTSNPRQWNIGLVGYGEVGRILAEDLRKQDVKVSAYDIKLGGDQAGPLRIVAGRQIQQRAAVAVGGFFPIDVAVQTGMPALLAGARIEERLVGVGNDAAVGKGRGVESDERDLRQLERLRAAGRLGRRLGNGGRLLGGLLCRFRARSRRHQ